MGDIIDLDEERVKRNSAKAFFDLPSGGSGSISDTRFDNAFDVFRSVSGHGNRRQREFLYEILWSYHIERRPISVDEMTELMISYIRDNRKYFEKMTGKSMTFNYDRVPDAQEVLRRMNLCVRKSPSFDFLLDAWCADE